MTLFRPELERMNALAAALPDTPAVDAPPRCERCDASYGTSTALGALCPHEPKCQRCGWTLIAGNPQWCSACDALDWAERTFA